MSDAPSETDAPEPTTQSTVESRRPLGTRTGVLRGKLPAWKAALFALACIGIIGVFWWLATAGEESERWVNAYSLPSPASTFRALSRKVSGAGQAVPMDVRLIRGTINSLTSVFLGFSLAALIGVPLGIACGCFAPVNAFFRPVIEFGRNVPMAALLALLILFLGAGVAYRIGFICCATVAFIAFDAAQAIRDVPQSYVDTAYTLGATRWRIVWKVLTPLAMPSIFNSLRLLFGLAFGYITLTEAVDLGGEGAGLGALIEVFRRQGPREGIYLILIVIPLVAFGIDRLLYFVQVQLFPYRFGGEGWMSRGVRTLVRFCEDAWRTIRPAAKPPEHLRREWDEISQGVAAADASPGGDSP